jgi:chromosome segregation ATPase
VHATRAAKDDLERRAEAGEHARREVEAQLRAVQERYATAASALEQASATVQQLRGELAQEKQARQLAEDAEQRAGSRVEAMEQSYEMGMEELRAREEQRREAVEREHAARRELEPKVMEAEVRLKNEEQRARDLESKVASLEAQMRSLADANGRLTAELDLSRSAARELKEEMVCVCVCVCVVT